MTSTALHVLAMVLMLCDHLWATIIPGNNWLTCIGRLSFPIFAFLTTEGYFHTKDLKKYMKRLLVFALISEIPFNLMTAGFPINPFHQNVLWTFLISIGLIHINEKIRKTNKRFLSMIVCALSILFGAVLGLLLMVDYYHAGILTVLTFYFLRGRKWWNYAGQLAALWFINAELLGGLGYWIPLFGTEIYLQQQSLAILALIPIFLYKGRQGYYNKTLKSFYYWFYPVHMLILALIMMIFS